jgi:hypothetical protein
VTDGKLRQYYWHIYSFLAERSQILDVTHKTFQFPDESLVELGGIFKANIVFYDGSQLVVRTRLDATKDVQEYDYAYVYLDQSGKRIIQYDDAPHHSSISTHPHHCHRGTNRMNAFILHPRKMMADVCFSRQDLQD